MMDQIKTALKKCGVENWRITEERSETAELYFVKKELDIPRKKSLTRYSVTLFRDAGEGEGRTRAATNAILTPGMTGEEMESRIRDAYFAAQFTGNPWFDLPAPEKCAHIPSTSDLAALTPEAAAMALAGGIFAVDDQQDAFLNSVEIFVTKSRVHMVGSNGLDVSFDKCEAKGELVAQCIAPKDVEQFREFQFDRLDVEALQKRALDAIRDVRARARSTVPPKAGTYDVVLTGEHITELLQYYCARTSAAMIYPGYSRWEKGMNVQGEGIVGEKLDLELVPSEPYSEEGVKMERRTLLREGRMELIHGPVRFCAYLKTPPTGYYEKVACGNGTVPYADLCGEGVLEPVSFSDFQMDPMDGHFKGEIRLALLHHADGTVEELSGGSINGSLPEAQKNLLFSKERYEDSAYAGPLAVKLCGVQVAGL